MEWNAIIQRISNTFNYFSSGNLNKATSNRRNEAPQG